MDRTAQDSRKLSIALIAALLGGAAIGLAGCDKTTSSDKTKTQRTTETPNGTQTTTTTTEKKVETDPK